ncbi:MAG TPA: hypothetical protein VGL80_22670 [Pseudonocardiaceae bacterium]
MRHTIDIPDVDDETYTVLQARADTEHLSLSDYLRRELDKLVSRPSMDPWALQSASPPPAP